MDNMEYYKSLISDEEVIKALVKETRAREGELFKEKTRVRPNLNFFQRTVTNLVSSNKRITTIPEFVPKERNKYARKVKTPHALMREILMTNKINFVKPEDSKDTEYARKSPLRDVTENQSSDKVNEYFSKTDSPPKMPPKTRSIHFNLNFDRNKFVSAASSSISEDLPRYEKRKPCDTSEDSIISISSTESSSSSSLSSTESDVISISDSDEELNSNKSQLADRNRPVKREKFYRKKCKKRKKEKDD